MFTPFFSFYWSMFIVPRSQVIPVFPNDIYPAVYNPLVALHDVTSPVIRHEIEIRKPASWFIYHVIIPHNRGASFRFNLQVSFGAIRAQIRDVIGFSCPWLKKTSGNDEERENISVGKSSVFWTNEITNCDGFPEPNTSLLSLWKTAQRLGYSVTSSLTMMTSFR